MGEYVDETEHPSYSDISCFSPWMEAIPVCKSDEECNLCNQPLKLVKSKDTNAKLYYCSACKTIKQILEDDTVRVMG